jgi:hypothetical protein
MRLDRNSAIIAAIAAALSAAVTFCLCMNPQPAPIVSRRATTTVLPEPSPATADLGAAALASYGAISGAHRDPFRFNDAPPQRAAHVTRVAIPAAVQALVVALPVIPARDETPHPPELPYRCIGRFGPANAPLVALAGDHEVVNAHAGDVVAGKFIVRSIGVESVDIGFVGFPPSADRRIAIGR